MRVIKFKFWNKKLKLMSKPSRVGVIWEHLCAEWGTFDWPDIETLEYIGQTDKNGKEIYEGYIVHLKDWMIDVTEPVVFSDCCFSCDTLNLANHDDIEVVGNIYENPELLNET